MVSNVDIAVEIASALISRFEGLRLRPYLCSAGVPTIGVGCTFYEDGQRVTLLDTEITASRAESLLCWMVQNKFLPAVVRLCPGIDSPERLAAIIDFTFNLGDGNLRASSLRRKINAGLWDDVPTELRKWTRGGGKVLKGLVIRRETEAKLVA